MLKCNEHADYKGGKSWSHDYFKFIFQGPAEAVPALVPDGGGLAGGESPRTTSKGPRSKGPAGMIGMCPQIIY